MKTAKQEAQVWAEYQNLSKRGMLSSYDWFVVTINAIVNGKQVVLVTHEFDEQKRAWSFFGTVRASLAPKNVVVQ